MPNFREKMRNNLTKAAPARTSRDLVSRFHSGKTRFLSMTTRKQTNDQQIAYPARLRTRMWDTTPSPELSRTIFGLIICTSRNWSLGFPWPGELQYLLYQDESEKAYVLCAKHRCNMAKKWCCFQASWPSSTKLTSSSVARLKFHVMNSKISHKNRLTQKLQIFHQGARRNPKKN